jgi:hypothetical protein
MASIWTQLKNVSGVVAVVGVGVAAWPLLACTMTVADLMFSPVYANLDPGLLSLAETARGSLTEETAPSGMARWQLTAPACVGYVPFTDYAPGFALLALGVFGWFFGRRSAAIAAEVPYVDDERLAEKQRAQTLLKPKPLSAEADVKPIEVEVDDSELGIGNEISPDSPDAHLYEDDGDSLMAFVQDHQPVEDDELEEASAIDGFFCPPGYGNKPVAYVDPEHPQASDDLEGEGAFGNRERPWATVEGAIAHIQRRLLTDVPGAMIRLMPGVYQTSLNIPDRVCVVNHRTPAEGDDAARLRWISGLTATHPDAVTILAPPEAPHAVKFQTGRNHGLVGCHVVSRDDTNQLGIVADGAQAVGMLYCVVEGFKRGGAKFTLAGNAGASMAIQVRGCIFRENESKEGGAILIERSVARFHTCIFSKNRAKAGGAVFVRDSTGVSFVKCRFEGNRAQARPPKTVDPELLELHEWAQMSGLGGGLALLRSSVQIHKSEFVDNGASVAGGGFSAVHSNLLINGTESVRARVARNKSRVGGGGFVVGLRSGASTVRLNDVDLTENTARNAGGGLAIVGLAEAKVSDVVVDDNSADADGAWGGGVSAHKGARFLATRTALRRNRSKGCGGGICAINASVKLGDKSELTENAAFDAGGGAYVITDSSAAIDSMVAANELELPFVLDIDKARVRRNVARGLGGGIRLGNVADHPTPALGVKLNPAKIRSNSTRSDNGAASDIWFEWAGDIVASALTTPERKFVLK